MFSVKISGTKNEFHVQMACIMAVVAIIGLDRGSMILAKVPTKPLPSISEDSSSSLGSP
ncbi:hypothetical protein D3C81_2278350 [compost metagenome]